MPRHRQRKALPYSTAQMFDLVADIESYPDFLPWCVGSRIINENDAEITAELVIGFKMFRERFTSEVTLRRPGHIHVNYVKGPLRYLHNDWRFSSRECGGSTIDFFVDFEFKNRVFEKMVGGLFSEAVRRMVDAFEKRAHALYGDQPAKTRARGSTIKAARSNA